MDKYYVEFWYPGCFVSECDTREITEAEFENPEKIVAPKNAYSFRLFKQEVVKGKIGNLFGEKRYDVDKTYYLGGEILTYKDVVTLKGEHSILADNMRGNKWDCVIKTKCGQFFPFMEGDVIL